VSRGPIFDRSVELSWLDEALRLRREGHADARQKLEVWMRDRVESAGGRKKTMTVLTRIWLDPPEPASEMVSWASTDAPPLDDTRVLHIGAMLATHGFFGRVCALVGRQLGLEGTVHTEDLCIGLRKAWGDREVVDVGVRSVIRTLRGLRVLSGRAGSSESARGEQIEVPPRLSPWLAHALTLSRGAAELDARDLSDSAEFFMLEIPLLRPDGYPLGDVFTEGGGRVVFRPKQKVDPRRGTRQPSLPGIKAVP